MNASAWTVELHTVLMVIFVIWLTRRPVNVGRYGAWYVPLVDALYKLVRQPNPVVFVLQTTDKIRKERILEVGLYDNQMPTKMLTIMFRLSEVDRIVIAEQIARILISDPRVGTSDFRFTWNAAWK